MSSKSLSASDYFALFGITQGFSIDLKNLKKRYYQLQQSMHPDLLVGATPADQQKAIQDTAYLNEAYQTLRTPLKRAMYLLQLQGVEVHSETDTHMPEDFLMAQMALREQWTEWDEAQKAQVFSEARQTAEAELSALLDKHPVTLEALEAARLCIREQLFYERLEEGT